MLHVEGTHAASPSSSSSALSVSMPTRTSIIYSRSRSRSIKNGPTHEHSRDVNMLGRIRGGGLFGGGPNLNSNWNSNEGSKANKGNHDAEENDNSATGSGSSSGAGKGNGMASFLSGGISNANANGDGDDRHSQERNRNILNGGDDDDGDESDQEELRMERMPEAWSAREHQRRIRQKLHRQQQRQHHNLQQQYGTAAATILQGLGSSRQLINLTLTGVQFGLCFYLVKAIWTAIVEVVDELNDSTGGGGSGGPGGGLFGVGGDDYDSPYLKSDVVDSATFALVTERVKEAQQKQRELQKQHQAQLGLQNEEHGHGNGNGDESGKDGQDSSSSTSTSKSRTRHSPFVSELAMRLSASGLPLVSPNDTNAYGSKTANSSSSSLSSNTSTRGANNSKHKIKSVRSILKSLTRSEGKLLASTLLASPVPTHMHDAEERSTKLVGIWEGIGGIEDAKEGLMDLVFPLMEQHNSMMKQAFSTNSENDNGENLNGDADGNQDQTKDVSEVDSLNNDDLLSAYYGGLLHNPPGVLLYGPPGCGKTMLCRALASTANARFLCVTPSTLLRKYVGETNINVKALFTLARKISPCIIFIDELEGLFRERKSSGSEEHEVNRELKTELMQHWDGINSNSDGDGIIIIGATNRPFDVDSAFLRRMPRSFFVGLPDRNARVQILTSMLSNVPLHGDFNMNYLADATAEYTPSDMKEVLRTAALFPLREARTSMLQNSSNGNTQRRPMLRPLETRDVAEACRRVAPTQLTNEYRLSLMNFAAKASGRGHQSSQQPPFGESADDAYSNHNNHHHHNSFDNAAHQHRSPTSAYVSDFSTFGGKNSSHPGEASNDYLYQDSSDEYDDDSYDSYDDHNF